jgi:hypothetical protein
VHKKGHEAALKLWNRPEPETPKNHRKGLDFHYLYKKITLMQKRNGKVATVLDSIPASSDSVESEGAR